MPLNNLTVEEKLTIYQCLKCVASGEVILHDWEFQTVFGIEASELIEIFEQWPDIDDSEESVYLAINNSMNNLLGYPHGKHETWEEVMPIPQKEIARVFQKWRGEAIPSYFDGAK